MFPLLLGFFLIFLISSPAWASTSVVINEILPQSATEEDWIELYNPTDQEVNLNGWVLKDKANSPLKEFGANDSVLPKGFLVVEVDKRLNNANETVSLLQNGTVIDSYSYATSSLETSFGRSPDASSSWVSFPAPTKGSANNNLSSSPTPILVTSGISLSEFFPYPESGTQEWVELYNDNLTTVSVTGFKIDDVDGGSSPYTIPEETIPAKGYLFVHLPTSILNNDSDTIRLLSPNNDVLETFTYPKATRSSSWAKTPQGKWEETSLLTLGKTNSFITSTPTTETKATTTTPTKTPTPTVKDNDRVLALATTSASPSSSISKIKIDLEDDKEKEAVLVKSASFSRFFSWGLIGMGIVVLAITLVIFIKKKKHA